MHFIARISLPLVLLGSILFFAALPVMSADGSSPDAMTWRDIALAAVGLVAAIAGAYAKGQDGRIKAIESAVAGLNLIAYRIEQAERKMEAALQKFERPAIHVPYHMRPDEE